MKKKHDFMLRAYRLALLGVGKASPNPMVGAVVVREGEIVGQGTHIYSQLKHAEIIALEQAGSLARDADLYVTLEPCSHYGRTPPCTLAIVQYGIKRVFCGMTDPNPLVSGKGLKFLRDNGIEVELWNNEEVFRLLNRAFIKYITQRKPWIVLKAAMTLDAKMAPISRKRVKITGDKAHRFSQFLRYKCDAIMVGAGTIISDDPLLTCRYKREKGRPLLRVILDGKLSIPSGCRIVNSAKDNPLVIYTSEIANSKKISGLEKAGVEVVVFGKGGRLNLSAVLDDLAHKQVTSIIVEGGTSILAQFLEEGLGDEFYFFYAPDIWGSKGISAFDNMMRETEFPPLIRGAKILGKDLLVYGLFNKHLT